MIVPADTPAQGWQSPIWVVAQRQTTAPDPRHGSHVIVGIVDSTSTADSGSLASEPDPDSVTNRSAVLELGQNES